MTPLPTTIPAIVRSRVKAAARRTDRTRRAAPLTPQEAEARAVLLRLLSLLLQYPDTELAAARPVLTATVEAMAPSPAADHLTAFTRWFTEQEPEALERHYVEMFDLRRKSSLYLTYYLHGDTRRRGMALLTLAQRYRAAGWDIDGGELPDHLPVVLEFAALTGPGRGEAPLRQHRRGLELIHHALTDADSPYRNVLAALLTLLPPPTEADLAAVAELAAQGPPEEEVGLDPYGAHGDGEFAPPGNHGAGEGARAGGHGAGTFTRSGSYGAGEFAPPGTFVPPEQAPTTLTPPLSPPEGRR
ncbi:nitrate reductase molybdenum cofactor assembly chaperone [Streptomyces brasiliensis]|uniref:Nitrate reductase molybdenum cofactor assembly chaperone n=1 Tax=Streptomyces brasiliensis TaxID=1954 RepID=A0A917NFX9_9ACTN|nr:nitrate reductase molybdenum cofactor assembly chaperone [Streptomyces brasiliensis]GGI94320.1 nitrate reductase molybdenum cofactor assembly chaperone [Streptomyces brasiliensis]